MQTAVYEKVVRFDKVDYRGTGRRNYTPEVEFGLELHSFPGHRTIDLEPIDNYLVFSASGGIWNTRMTDMVMAGQCLDEILELCPGRSQLQHLATIWKRWHLNSLHAGTTRQDEILELMTPVYPWLMKDRWDYDGKCKILDLSNALVDRGYKYGSAWLVEPLPAEIVLQVLDLFPNVAPKINKMEEVLDGILL